MNCFLFLILFYLLYTNCLKISNGIIESNSWKILEFFCFNPNIKPCDILYNINYLVDIFMEMDYFYLIVLLIKILF